MPEMKRLYSEAITTCFTKLERTRLEMALALIQEKDGPITRSEYVRMAVSQAVSITLKVYKS